VKLYTITHVRGYVVDWAGTQAAAKAAVRTQGEATGFAHTWQEHEVPTDKPKLMAWLKQHAVRTPGE
jgi:hypothetical protein